MLDEREIDIGIEKADNAVAIGPELMRDLAERLSVQFIAMPEMLDIAGINNGGFSIQSQIVHETMSIIGQQEMWLYEAKPNVAKPAKEKQPQDNRRSQNSQQSTPIRVGSHL